jgi:hypothetical protein
VKYLIRVIRKDDGYTREIAEQEWDANEELADEIGEQAGSMIAEAIQCDVAKEKA